MKVEILETFIGFPEGVEKPERTFIGGAVVDVDDAFGRAMIEKGHVRAVSAAPTRPTPSKEATHEAE